MKSAPRQVKQQGRFSPGKPDLPDHAVFVEFWVAANERINSLNRKKLVRKKAESAKNGRLRRKVGVIFGQVFRGQLSPAAAGEKIKHLVPDEKARRDVFDFWTEAVKKTPAQLKKEQQEIALEGAALAKSEKILKASGAITDAVTQLNELAATGYAEAAKALMDAANLSVLALTVLEKSQPEIIGRLARTETTWPVLTDGNSGWEKKAAERLTRLNLGADMTAYRTRFRRPRGAEVNFPARKWAKAAVRTIEETRFRHLIFGRLLKGFESAGDLAGFMLETGWDYGVTPDWVGNVCKLGAFSMESLPDWKRAIRKMIRQEMPDFQERPEWATQRASADARGRGTPGEIKNAILDDICSALERLTPPA